MPHLPTWQQGANRTAIRQAGNDLIELLIEHKIWPVAGTFRISHSALTQIDTVWVTLQHDGHRGRGECRPYARYADSVESVTAQIEALRSDLKNGLTQTELQTRLPAGPARNALDCAMWDLQAKKSQKPVYELAGLPKPAARQTAYTLSIDSPGAMAKAAKAAKNYPVLKIKINDEAPLACIQAVNAARPDAKLIVDANEALSPDEITNFHAALQGLNIALIEQPIKAGKEPPGCFPIGPPIFCADESLHTVQDLSRLKTAGYGAVNVKLDKCGGFTAATQLVRAAKDQGFIVMAGCMVASSLAMAPMLMLESFADFIDLDGPLLLAKDCEGGLKYENASVSPPSRTLWG